MTHLTSSLQVSPNSYSFTLPSRRCFSFSSPSTLRTPSFPDKPKSRSLFPSTFFCHCLNRPQSSLRLRNNGTAPADRFASLSSRGGKQTTSVGVPPPAPVPPPSSSSIGSPLFWIGVGVALSALFAWVAGALKKYAMQQAFKAMMGQMNPQSNQFPNSPFPNVPPNPFPTSPPRTTTQTPPPSRPAVTVDIPATKVEATKAEAAPATDFKKEPETKEEPKKFAFVDVSPEETKQESPFESFTNVTEATASADVQSASEVSQNGAASSPGFTAPEWPKSTGKGNPALSVDALEKMMEDPTVQKMVYPHLPEEMRNPETFKWMLQNPQYRQQLEEMLNNMSGSSEWDNRMMDSLKNFDLSSPEVKQQFDQIGLTPEDVISKIMANPDVAMAFQNPRVQQAIMDCSQNPLSIAKYQNDKEVMDVFNKISELFPGAAGSN